MSGARYAWALRRRVLGDQLVVLSTHIRAIEQSGVLRLPARTRIRALYVRELVLGPPNRARIRVGGTSVNLGGEGGFAVDWHAFTDIFGLAEYLAPFAGAHVLDIGAHKGYFGAFALASGAMSVLSFEPESANYAALEQAARPVGDHWLTRNAAVGALNGSGTLFLDRTSWAHSLVHAERPAGSQQVEIVAFDQALAELPPGGSRTIVKVDAEGSECEILSCPDTLREVDHVLVEWHPVASCSRRELADRLGQAGLTLEPGDSNAMHFVRR